jgi:Rieske Fe-S protein
MEKPDRKRRSFIAALILALSGLWFFGAFFRPRLPSGKVRLDVPLRPVPAEGALVFRQARVALVREGEEIHALDLTCTHLGCTVAVTSTELICPCHGSRFDRRGNVLRGPAEQSLRRLTVEERDGRWVVAG